MDTFAAVALASEKPHPSIIRTPPTKPGVNVLTKQVWRQIYGVAIWNIIVITILVLFGQYMWDLDFQKNDEFYYKLDKNTTAPIATYTAMIFANSTEVIADNSTTSASSSAPAPAESPVANTTQASTSSS
jgi:magnesium-transporting ATPase (P-type)